ncbi:MAG: Tryptophan--tRNA ligase, mitochondrial [Cirrosporium novae-zelandiae]|nr:MAG: Tryptophan--tRNA ligase, mitochondrial [Cirrosporium novae-zelandiae]
MLKADRNLLRYFKVSQPVTVIACLGKCYPNKFSQLSQTRFQSSQSTLTSSAPTASDVVFSGIQPTGIPHLGNYLGALRQWVQMQNAAPPGTKLIYSVADLHAITMPQDPGKLRQWRRESFAALLAIGLDCERSTVYFQSAVLAHAELMWILSCTASMGYLSRMTQWKSKLSLPDSATPADQASKNKLKLGLFSYPVLQAADVLIHRATHVPVGEDQAQHLEFARDVALGFNNIYGKILTVPQTVLSPARRVMSLKDPKSKMSKSAEDPRSRILITDSRDEIDKKIRRALTDSTEGLSYDTKNRPGVSNLLDIMSHLNDDTKPPEELANEFKSLSMREFKEHVAATIDHAIAPIREKYFNLMEGDDGRQLDKLATMGAEKAQASANVTMEAVKTAIGFA